MQVDTSPCPLLKERGIRGHRAVAQFDSADEKVTKCHVRGEVALVRFKPKTEN